jgi:hypothetical protein
MRPPLLARALLTAVAGEADAEFVAGDLEEEFADLRGSRPRSMVNRWYLRQVVRSVLPLLALRIRSGELSRVLLSPVVGVALPLMLLDRLWCFVYSQIPLKDGVDRAPAFLAVNVVLLCVCAAIAGFQTRSIERASAPAVATAISAGFAMWASTGAAPFAYAVLMLVLVPASSFLSVVWRRSL